MSKKDWEEITDETFKKVFKNTALKRTKFEGIQRNINFLKA
jgi:epoxyqueuosine reductase